MQTKKRAKPVKFGKTKVHEVEKREEKEEPQEEEVIVRPMVVEKPVSHAEKKTMPWAKDVHKHVEHEEEEDPPAGGEEEDEKEIPESPRETRKPVMISEEEIEEESPPVQEREKVTQENIPASIETEESEIHEPQSSFYGPPPPVEKKKSFFGYFLIIAFVAFLIGLVVITGGNYLFGQKDFSFPSFQEPTPTPTNAPTPTPTEAPVDLKSYKIKILNGSGVTGEAAKLKDKLVAAGFTVESTGNADKDTFEKTEVSVSKKVNKQYLQMLEKELKKSYTLDAASPTDDNTATDADVVITIGIDTP